MRARRRGRAASANYRNSRRFVWRAGRLETDAQRSRRKSHDRWCESESESETNKTNKTKTRSSAAGCGRPLASAASPTDANRSAPNRVSGQKVLMAKLHLLQQKAASRPLSCRYQARLAILFSAPLARRDARAIDASCAVTLGRIARQAKAAESRPQAHFRP